MSERILNVYGLPRSVTAEELAGSTVVVIDALRATSTICQALASGAREVVPFLEVAQAREAVDEDGRDGVVLGGERGGKRIDGFDLGNSPSEYTPEAIRGQRVLITTTNGTRAMNLARQARRVVLGSFLNLSAVVASLKNEPRVDILCAGTEGVETGEDILAAGAIVDRLAGDPNVNFGLNEAATAARKLWQALVAAAPACGRTIEAQLAIEMRTTPGGRNLTEIGMDQDVVDCAKIDRLNIVPDLDLKSRRITAR
jgi:2-phosphosulfolactate phosphatase